MHDDRQCVLLIRRARSVGWDPGLWELPGGKGEWGETLQDTLAREAREETGLTIEVREPIHVTHFKKEPFWVTTVTFICELVDGDVELSDEHEEFAWVELAGLDNRECTDPAREALDAYAARAGAGGRES